MRHGTPQRQNGLLARIPRKAWLGSASALALAVVLSLVFTLVPGKGSSSSGQDSPGLAQAAETPVRISGPGAHGVAARVDERAPKVPGPATALGPVWHIGPDGPLDKPVTIQLPLSHQVPADQRKLVLVFTRESLASGQYTPLPATVVDGGRYAQVTVNRLSWFTPVQLDVQGAMATMKQMFDSLTDGAYTPADQPQCPGHTQALKGYELRTQGTDALLWCFGLDGKGTRIVKVISNRRYALLVTHQAMSLMESSGSSILLDIGKLLSPGGVVLYPRDTATFSADEPPGKFGKVVSDVGQEAQLMSSLDVGMKAMLAIVTKFGWGKAPDVTLGMLDKMLTLDACLHSTDVVAMVANCFSPQELTVAFGLVAGAVLVPLMTLAPVVNYFEGVLNGIFDQFNQRARFGIGVTNTASPTDSFAGEWNHHTNLLLIRSNLAASVILPLGPCFYYDPSKYSQGDGIMCQEDADIGFAPSGNGLSGTVNLVDIAVAHKMDAPSVSVSTDATKMLVHLNDSFEVLPYQGGVIKLIWPGGGDMTMCHLGSNGYHIGLELKAGQTEGLLCGA